MTSVSSCLTFSGNLWAQLSLHFPLQATVKLKGHVRPAETQEVSHMQRHYKEHCLGLGTKALILHGSQGEQKPLKLSSSSLLPLPLVLSAYPTLLLLSPVAQAPTKAVRRLAFRPGIGSVQEGTLRFKIAFGHRDAPSVAAHVSCDVVDHI